MTDADARLLLFEAARERAGLSVEQLWVRYLNNGGILSVFEVEAFLAGVGSFPDHEQDVLAAAVNDRLLDLYRASCVPYLSDAHPAPPAEDALAVIAELQADRRPPSAMS